MRSVLHHARRCLSAAPTRNTSRIQLDQMDATPPAEMMEKLSLAMMPKEPFSTSTTAGAPTRVSCFLSCDGSRVSSGRYWLHAPGGGFHAVIEITRQTKAKMEICTTEAVSPIKQDLKKELRDYNMPIKWNYGAFPQTWEQPEHVWNGLEGHKGDNDPVDLVDHRRRPSTVRHRDQPEAARRRWR